MCLKLCEFQIQLKSPFLKIYNPVKAACIKRGQDFRKGSSASKAMKPSQTRILSEIESSVSVYHAPDMSSDRLTTSRNGCYEIWSITNSDQLCKLWSMAGLTLECFVMFVQLDRESTTFDIFQILNSTSCLQILMKLDLFYKFSWNLISFFNSNTGDRCPRELRIHFSSSRFIFSMRTLISNPSFLLASYFACYGRFSIGKGRVWTLRSSKKIKDLKQYLDTIQDELIILLFCHPCRMWHTMRIKLQT